jgi:2-dehydro-3-deoxygluconokinase
VSTLGEAMLRLSVKDGERLEDAPAYEVHVAGAEANVAFALARVGIPALWASALPPNPLGRRVASTLAAGGVDVSTVLWVDDSRLGTYFVEFGPAPRGTQVVYDREASAAADATVDNFDWDRILDATAFHISGITFAMSEASGAVARHAVGEARRRGLFVSFDVNYRLKLSSPQQAADVVRKTAPMIDLLMCPASDAALLFGLQGDTEEVAGGLRDELGIASVVVTNGATGAAAASEAGTLSQPAYDVEVVDRIGAGDAFAAGLLWGVLAEDSLRTGLQRGAAMAALKMTLRGDLFRLGSAEVHALQAGHTFRINR